jgi:hypothetical protein
MQPRKSEISINKNTLIILNQLFEIERKMNGNEELNKISRNIERIKDALNMEFNGTEIFYEDPTGQQYNETRNDLEAHIVGESTDDLVVIDVIKPIIRVGNKQLGLTQVVQRGVVSVESKANHKEEK